MLTEKIKQVSVLRIEAAIAKVVSELIKEDVDVSISDIDFWANSTDSCKIKLSITSDLSDMDF